MTTYKAVKVGNVRPGDLVIVSGVGGLGHRTRVSYETRPLAYVHEAIAEVLQGKAKARLVLEP